MSPEEPLVHTDDGTADTGMRKPRYGSETFEDRGVQVEVTGLEDPSVVRVEFGRYVLDMDGYQGTEAHHSLYSEMMQEVKQHVRFTIAQLKEAGVEHPIIVIKGAGTGIDTDILANEFPEAIFIAVEKDKKAYDILERRTREEFTIMDGEIKVTKFPPNVHVVYGSAENVELPLTGAHIIIWIFAKHHMKYWRIGKADRMDRKMMEIAKKNHPKAEPVRITGDEHLSRYKLPTFRQMYQGVGTLHKGFTGDMNSMAGRFWTNLWDTMTEIGEKTKAMNINGGQFVDGFKKQLITFKQAIAGIHEAIKKTTDTDVEDLNRLLECATSFEAEGNETKLWATLSAIGEKTGALGIDVGQFVEAFRAKSKTLEETIANIRRGIKEPIEKLNRLLGIATSFELEWRCRGILKHVEECAQIEGERVNTVASDFLKAVIERKLVEDMVDPKLVLDNGGNPKAFPTPMQWEEIAKRWIIQMAYEQNLISDIDWNADEETVDDLVVKLKAIDPRLLPPEIGECKKSLEDDERSAIANGLTPDRLCTKITGDNDPTRENPNDGGIFVEACTLNTPTL